MGKDGVAGARCTAIRGTAASAIGAVLAFCLACHHVGAQELNVNSWAEAGGDGIYLLHSELSLARAGMGVRPVASLGGYLVVGEGEAVWGANPMVGLRYRTDAGFVQVKLGWAFRDEIALAYFGGSDGGFQSAAQGEFWGDLYNAKGLVTYNWGGDYLWGQARMARRMADLAEGGSWGLGAELIFQSETTEPSGLVERFGATQVGPVIQWTPGAARPTFSFSGGWKRTEVGGGTDSWYLRAELSLL
jgi:hypothetical protein